MTDKTIARSRAEVSALGDMHNQLEALDAMNVAQLAEKYRELYGEPTRSRNKEHPAQKASLAHASRARRRSLRRRADAHQQHWRPPARALEDAAATA